MKQLTILFLLVTSLCTAQIDYNEETNTFTFLKIDSVKLSKKQIHNNSKIWLAKSFKDSKAVISFDNEEQLIGKGNFEINITSGGYPLTQVINFTISIYFKESKFKFELERFEVATSSAGTSYKTALEDYRTDVTYEDFKRILLKQTEKMDGSTKKMMQKYYKKEKNLKTAFANGRNISKQVMNAVNDKVNNIYKSYVNSISTKKEDW